MPRIRRTRSIRYVGAGSILPYSDRVKGIQTASLIGYWPMWEAAGATADNYEGTAARDATYTAVTLGQTGIGDTHTCPLFGAASYVDLNTASLRTAFNFIEGSFAVWFKVLNAGIWTDTFHHTIFTYWTDAGKYIIIEKSATDDVLRYLHTARQYLHTPFSSTAWNHLALTWSATGTAVCCYLNGLQVDGGLGAPDAAGGAVAAFYLGTFDGVNYPWAGWMAHAALWSKALTAPEVVKLATV